MIAHPGEKLKGYKVESEPTRSEEDLINTKMKCSAVIKEAKISKEALKGGSILRLILKSQGSDAWAREGP
jgi:hypothetical protein